MQNVYYIGLDIHKRDGISDWREGWRSQDSRRRHETD